MKNTREKVSWKASIYLTWDWNFEIVLGSGHSLSLFVIKSYMISDNDE